MLWQRGLWDLGNDKRSSHAPQSHVLVFGHQQKRDGQGLYIILKDATDYVAQPDEDGAPRAERVFGYLGHLVSLRCSLIQREGNSVFLARTGAHLIVYHEMKHHMGFHEVRMPRYEEVASGEAALWLSQTQITG